MCGYVKCYIASKNLNEFMGLLGLGGLFPETRGGGA